MYLPYSKNSNIIKEVMNDREFRGGQLFISIFLKNEKVSVKKKYCLKGKLTKIHFCVHYLAKSNLTTILPCKSNFTNIDFHSE